MLGRPVTSLKRDYIRTKRLHSGKSSQHPKKKTKKKVKKEKRTRLKEWLREKWEFGEQNVTRATENGWRRGQSEEIPHGGHGRKNGGKIFLKVSSSPIPQPDQERVR